MFLLEISLVKENALSRTTESSFEEWKLVTFKDGFIVGIFAALVIQLGIINITTSMQKAIVGILLLAGLVTSINQAFRRKALINPSWDGFISGFGTLVGIINLLYPQLSIL
jgi:uncharacterized membrane protein HdeD (DUF308 family)